MLENPLSDDFIHYDKESFCLQITEGNQSLVQ